MTRRSVPPERLVIAAFDALAASVSILDGPGEILAVNEAWEAFARENGGGSSRGSNYLRVCDLAEGEDCADAHTIAAGIRAVLAGERELFEYEYPCHVPSGPGCFFSMLPG